MGALVFNITHQEGKSRTGYLQTGRGKIHTPAFMPVGTAATVKAMFPGSVKQTGAEIILGNTYHLMLRPGAERIQRLGGLHHFMRWDGPILTDSGGYQVMSLASMRKLSKEGVTFRSHLDGTKYVLTPERSMGIQYLLGSDITMIFDECTPYPATEEEAKQSMELSLGWAERSKQAYKARPGYGLFGIVQGSTFAHLRDMSSRALVRIGFDGYAIGGLAVGEGQKLMFEVLDYTVGFLPQDKPRYLMGVGKPDDILGAVERGVDMFDCVLPTRSGRNGQAFTSQGPLNIRNACYAEDIRPLDEACHCPMCQQYSRAYIHHLVRANEILGAMVMTWHNLHFYQELMRAIRQSITQGNFALYKENFTLGYQGINTQ